MPCCADAAAYIGKAERTRFQDAGQLFATREAWQMGKWNQSIAEISQLSSKASRGPATSVYSIE
jgi:hypothetical protein